MVSPPIGSTPRKKSQIPSKTPLAYSDMETDRQLNIPERPKEGSSGLCAETFQFKSTVPIEYVWNDVKVMRGLVSLTAHQSIEAFFEYLDTQAASGIGAHVLVTRVYLKGIVADMDGMSFDREWGDEEWIYLLFCVGDKMCTGEQLDPGKIVATVDRVTEGESSG
ncbi:hypothetical protein LTR17_019972 [Elasticomyces elasticus]|nr:hypothetical protein LTR17_019972 [Elasticomyces elasticus]